MNEEDHNIENEIPAKTDFLEILQKENEILRAHIGKLCNQL